MALVRRFATLPVVEDTTIPNLVGGAGHDACYAAEVCDAGMLFAVSEGGHSHSSKEFTSDEDCYAAADTLANPALALAKE